MWNEAGPHCGPVSVVGVFGFRFPDSGDVTVVLMGLTRREASTM